MPEGKLKSFTRKSQLLGARTELTSRIRH